MFGLVRFRDRSHCVAPAVLELCMTEYFLSSRLEQFSREPPSSELGRAPWTKHKMSLMAFAHLPHAWRSLGCLSPVRLCLITSPLCPGRGCPTSPRRLLGRGSQVCTKSPLSGLETIVLPFMETRAGSYNQAFRGWIKGHCSSGCRDYGAVLSNC